MREKFVFLLGGHDLEMKEIAMMLSIGGYTFFDKKLNWENAALTAYTQELEYYSPETGTIIYGIELSGGTTQANYKRIDHHNGLDASPAAIEQIADLLGIGLSRYQQLVAANDKGYIPGMQQMKASPQEIAQIREKDRVAQGITVQDEEMAEEAVSTQTVCGETVVIYSRSNRFSPICDRMWPYKELLIYTHNSLCYYGKKKDKLVVHFNSEILANKMYYGGGPDGYLGTVQGAYTVQQLLQIQNTILKMG